MRGGSGGDMRAKIHKWESELWSCISSGDGERCPLYNHCPDRLSGKWCISEDEKFVELLLKTDRLYTENNAFADYEFLGTIAQCRMLNLVEALAQGFITQGKINHPPVPEKLVFLADDKQPIEIRLVPLTKLRGGIWRLKEGWVIQLNENDSPARRKFSLFHEAFHILAHCRAEPVFKKRGSDSGAFNELLAECFASYMLMPAEWVRERWLQIKDIDRMAAIFDVTKPQMWLKLKSLGLI